MPSASRATWLAVLMLAATAAGVVAVVHGFRAVDGKYILPWAPGALPRLAWLLAAILVALALATRFLRFSIVPATAVVAIAVLTLLGALWPVVVACAMTLAFVLVGRRLRAWWRDRIDGHEDPLLDVALGAGAYGTLVSVLAHFPVNTTALYALLLAAPIAWDRREVPGLLRRLVDTLRPARKIAPAPAWLAAALAIVYLLLALLPETGWDALAMHLFIPGHVAAHRLWSFDPQRFSWALMPALGDWVFTIAFLFDAERGARMLNAACAVLAAALTYRIALAAGARNGWAWFAAALALATPVMFAVGVSLFIDAEWTVFVLAAVLAFLRRPVPGQPPYAWITGSALLGLAAATKAVTLPMVPIVALLALAQWRAWRVPGGVRILGWSAVAFVLAACKPYLFAWFTTGNPVYPFFMHVFGGTPAFDFWTTGPQTFRQKLTFATPYDAIFGANRYIEGRIGAPGFQWLLLFPAAAVALIVAWHRRGLVLLAVGLGMLVTVFLFQSYLRYLLPAIALLTAAMAVAGTVLRETRWGMRFFALAGVASLGLNVAHLNAARHLDMLPLRALVDQGERSRYLLGAWPVLPATELAKQLPLHGARLGFFSTPAFASVAGADIVHASWYTPAFGRAVIAAASPQALAKTLQDWRVRYVIVDGWWSQPESRRLLLAATTPVAEFNGALVREVARDFMFEHEYLRNPDFASPEGWAFLGNARHEAGQRHVVVTVDSPAFQSVPVTPGSVYFNKVRARCPAPGSARVQVNWLDARNNFLSTSLRTFPCGAEWSEETQEVVAPPDARLAVVYATSADARAVAIGGVSFRGRKP